MTGQVVLDEDVTARLWADANALHVELRWAIPEYFRRDPTPYSAQALRRGSDRGGPGCYGKRKTAHPPS